MNSYEKTGEGEAPPRQKVPPHSVLTVGCELSAVGFPVPLYPVTVLELDCGQDFDPSCDEDFFAAAPPRPAVCLIEPRAEHAEPLLIRTQDCAAASSVSSALPIHPASASISAISPAAFVTASPAPIRAIPRLLPNRQTSFPSAIANSCASALPPS